MSTPASPPKQCPHMGTVIEGLGPSWCPYCGAWISEGNVVLSDEQVIAEWPWLKVQVEGNRDLAQVEAARLASASPPQRRSIFRTDQQKLDDWQQMAERGRFSRALVLIKLSVRMIWLAVALAILLAILAAVLVAIFSQ